MSLKKSLRTVLACCVLQLGVLTGVPMRPEHIRELMQLLNQPKLAQTNPGESHQGDGAPDGG